MGVTRGHLGSARCAITPGATDCADEVGAAVENICAEGVAVDTSCCGFGDTMGLDCARCLDHPFTDTTAGIMVMRNPTGRLVLHGYGNRTASSLSENPVA